MSQAINNHLVTNLSELSPVEASKKVIVPVIKDTLATSALALPGQVLGGRPKLEKPEASDPYKAAQMACSAIENSPENEEIINALQPMKDVATTLQSQIESEELKKVVTSSEKTEYRPRNNIEKMMVSFFNLQSEMEESFAATLTKELQLQQSSHAEKRESTFDLDKNLAEQKKLSDILGWVNFGATSAVIAAAVSIYFSKEASRLLKFGMSAASITGGVAMASKAIIEHQSSSKQGELFHINSDLRVISRIMEHKTEALTEIAEQLFEMAKMLREILDRKLETTKMIFG